jgi:3-isopropylmalate/(R)-2-methylmalate dehydratase large subunit
MLYLLSLTFFRQGGAIGKVLEFQGDGLSGLGIDERATLANMSVEAGAFTGIIEPDSDVLQALAGLRHVSVETLSRSSARSDPGAEYDATVEVDLTTIEPMVATPGDPKNGVPLSQIDADVRVDIAYGGSCAGAKRADMDAYAAVLRRALARGRSVAPGVKLYIQFGSQQVRRYAEAAGYVSLFTEAGAVVIEPSCGACIRAGPGVSERPDQVTISAANRNYPGRSGPGRVFLASPAVVAASAICGKIAGPEDL